MDNKICDMAPWANENDSHLGQAGQMRTILIWDFWRGGASAKPKCETEGGPGAIISAQANFVKSFLRGRTKFF